MYLLVAGMSGFITSTKVKMIQSSDEFLLGGRKEALEGEDDELMPSYHSLPLSPFSLILLDSSTCLDPLVSFSDSLYVGSFLANHPPQWKSTDHEFFFFFFFSSIIAALVLKQLTLKTQQFAMEKCISFQ